jgi:hypothetical protein
VAVPKNSAFELPGDLAALSDDELKSYTEQATNEFDTLDAEDHLDAAGVERLTVLAEGIKTLKGEGAARTQAAAELTAKREALRADVQATKDTESSEGEGEGEGSESAPAGEPVGAGAVTAGGARTRPANEARASDKMRGLNPSLADAQRRAPKPDLAPRRSEAVIIASADIPGFTTGGTLGGMDQLVAAMQAKARALPATRLGDDATRYPIAFLERKHKYLLDLDSTPEQVNEVLVAATDIDSLVAAGGWCAPSEISYDFFNIVCEDGMLDLPTVGINRGGIRWPTSPSFGDLVGNSAMWSWNETQDIAAVTGTAQSGTKTCARVPCPSFNEARLTCDGLCLTVGNLMEDAFPELIANHTRLLFAAHAHKMNGLRIQSLITQSSTAVTGMGSAGSGVVAPLIGAISLAAIDYRDKYAMCEDAILEVVLPRWIRSAMRSDLRKRTGVDLLEVADARLMRMFDAENVRVQWVNDWQVRASGYPGNTAAITSWPTTVDFMIFAPGTYVKGNGLRLDLGVMRDSVLNATNDHTAEWMEECWLIFKPGHESRRYVVPICPDGTTGAADLTACGV